MEGKGYRQPLVWSILECFYNAAGSIRDAMCVTMSVKLTGHSLRLELHKISHASGLKEAHHALGAFSRCWKDRYPKAVKCLMAACKSSC